MTHLPLRLSSSSSLLLIPLSPLSHLSLPLLPSHLCLLSSPLSHCASCDPLYPLLLPHSLHLMSSLSSLLSDCLRGKEDLGVRLSQDIPSQEKVFLQKRRRIVAQALQALLGLESPPSEDQVPTIAVVVSGGGARACTGLLGSLKGLKEMGVLDAVTYITTLSGSTWSETIHKMQCVHCAPLALTLSAPLMQYYYTEMEKKEKQGHLVSYIDMAGLIAEHFVFGQKNTSTLSDQKKTVTNGQNPLPIYTAVNVRCFSSAEWVEFTPFEVGLQKYGAFIRAENFDSEFFLGHLIKKLPELRLPFLIGIWSSAFSVNFTSLWKVTEHTCVSCVSETDNVHSTLDTVLLSPEQSFTAAFARFFKNRPIINQTFNFTRGLSLHQKYSDNSNFLSWKDSHPDAFPNQLTPSDPTLHLIDSGHSINIGCPPVLRPERHADVIIILSYSWDPQNIFKKTCEFCEEHKVPFPSPDFTELRQQPQREVYVYEDPETPAAPIVLHLPLVNISFRDQKAPGVKRETEEELAAGRVDVSSSASPYTTKNMTYSEDDYDSLIELTRYNALHKSVCLCHQHRNVPTEMCLFF
uniref:PLA2c domain-containing protein n=1 Tax=Periophthalmus magnuspinnatus TaxID=409849 RepID=A0A3B4B556_9GOBI